MEDGKQGASFTELPMTQTKQARTKVVNLVDL